ncbi:S1C family serine protease [Oceanobacillus senegalensis]|uniref:S1C family serine protease n=1 Tax=Oceanobacillus senegalensis TaxID=1936063 RepID=UPI000A311D98|nr:serine protease [Oceanobacillus senegalensis]
MDKREHNKPDVIDEDLYEEFDEEELYELVQEEKKKAIERAEQRKNNPTRRPFPKWIFWIIAVAMVINVLALIPQTYSIPAIEFLKTSASLTLDEDIQAYKQAVVVVETENSKGTGFAISSDGAILTNHHVIEDKRNLTVAFPDHGLFEAEVVKSEPSIDLAVLQVDGEELPHLTLAESPAFEQDQAIQFIGNPLRFNGIANEGNIIGPTKLDGWEEQVIMIEAPVYRGNSGSPIINEQGNVIGVIFATLNHDQHGKVGLFVPIDLYFKYVKK